MVTRKRGPRNDNDRPQVGGSGGVRVEPGQNRHAAIRNDNDMTLREAVHIAEHDQGTAAKSWPDPMLREVLKWRRTQPDEWLELVTVLESTEGTEGDAGMSGAPNVYACIAAVSAEIAKTGIAKDRSNATQGYKFRGIDEVHDALAPLLAKHGLVILPRMLSRECVERPTQKGGVLFSVTVEAEFDFVSAQQPDSKHTVRMFGEAMDSGDKATNKAMSAAYKYAAFQTFCIPIKGQPDADETTPEPVKATAPEGFDNWLADMETVASDGIEPLKAAWAKSQPYMRKFLTDTDPAKWEGIKAKAEKVKKSA